MLFKSPISASRARTRAIHTFEDSGIACTHFGEKPPDVVVINGGQGFMRQQTPRRLQRDLQRIARILPPNTSFVLLGYPKPAPDATLQELAERLAELIDRLFGPVILVGISFGGVVALRVASHSPVITRRLILISSAHELSETGKELVRQQLSNVLARDYIALMKSVTTIFRRPWRNLLLRTALWLGRNRLAKSMGDSQTIVRYLNALLECSTERPDWLNSIQAKTLVIGGKNDQFFGGGAMERTVARITAATLHLIDGERHMIMVECAPAVASSISDWLADARCAPASHSQRM